MKNKTKSEMTNFEVKVKEILNELGAIHLESLYTINTKYGKLNIKIDIDKSPIYSIFCKFEEKEKFDEYKNINEILDKNIKTWQTQLQM